MDRRHSELKWLLTVLNFKWGIRGSNRNNRNVIRTVHIGWACIGKRKLRFLTCNILKMYLPGKLSSFCLIK